MQPGETIGTLLTAAFATCLLAFPASACMFHTNLPSSTFTENLQAADRIILARDNGNYRFVATKSLRGDLDGIDILHLADSGTMRRLSLHPDDAVLFAHDRESRKWRRLAYVDEQFRPILAKLFELLPQWPQEYSEERFEFFATLFDHPDPAIRNIARLELDRAPYRLLRQLELHLSSEAIVADLWQLNEISWTPFNILLLGLKGDELAHSQVSKIVKDADGDTGWYNYLGPAATALVEMEGVVGVERLNEMFIADPSEPLDKLKLVVQALVLHNEIGSADLRQAISDALSTLIRSRPESASVVAQVFADRQDWSQAAALQNLLKSRKLSTPADIITVTTYLALARQSQAQIRVTQ